MDQHENPEEAAESGKDHLRATVGNIKEAASAKVEDLRQAAGQKAEELREAAQGKAQELKGTAETAWSDAKFRMSNWQAEGEAYVRANPTKSVLMALGPWVSAGPYVAEMSDGIRCFAWSSRFGTSAGRFNSILDRFTP